MFVVVVVFRAIFVIKEDTRYLPQLSPCCCLTGLAVDWTPSCGYFPARVLMHNNSTLSDCQAFSPTTLIHSPPHLIFSHLLSILDNFDCKQLQWNSTPVPSFPFTWIDDVGDYCGTGKHFYTAQYLSILSTSLRRDGPYAISPSNGQQSQCRLWTERLSWGSRYIIIIIILSGCLQFESWVVGGWSNTPNIPSDNS